MNYIEELKKEFDEIIERYTKAMDALFDRLRNSP